jgi:imidazole glycerol-phosphate synthase subunit HisH
MGPRYGNFGKITEVSPKIHVVDYGIGNVRSVCRAFEQVGADVILTDDPQELLSANRLVLPGVGAISHCMEVLKASGLAETLVRFVETERPLLGICVGMQLMMEISHEYTECSCFGWIEGDVIKIPQINEQGSPHKIPHIGWNSIRPPGGEQLWDGTILEDISAEDQVYFVHSFMANPTDPTTCLAQTEYNGVEICAAIRKGSIFGTQFHPEKSGITGLRIIENFLRL